MELPRIRLNEFKRRLLQRSRRCRPGLPDGQAGKENERSENRDFDDTHVPDKIELFPGSRLYCIHNLFLRKK